MVLDHRRFEMKAGSWGTSFPLSYFACCARFNIVQYSSRCSFIQCARKLKN